jgi:hypothetical protein
MFLLPNSYLTPMQLLERFYLCSMLIKVKRTNRDEVAVLSPTSSALELVRFRNVVEKESSPA